jgi:hypothetical protein
MVSFEIENFKAFGAAQSFPLRPITVVFGPNSAGKSSLLHALLYSQQNLITGRSNIDRISVGDEEIDIGGFEQFVFRQDLERAVAWTAGLRMPEKASSELKKAGIDIHSMDLKVQNNCVIQRDGTTPHEFSLNLTLDVNGTVLLEIIGYRPTGISQKEILREHTLIKGLTRSSSAAAAGTIAGLHLGGIGLATGLFNGLAFLPVLGPAIAGAGAILGARKLLQRSGPVVEPNDPERLVASLLTYCTDTIAQQIRNTAYIGPLRTYPRRQPSVHEDSSAVPDKHFDVWKTLSMNEEVRNSINKWIGPDGPLQTPYRIEGSETATPSRGLPGCRLIDLRTGATVTPRDIGVGISQVMPILVQVLAQDSNLVLVEQPEVHLHPRLQAELADVFISGIHSGKPRVFVLETHSEAMILRFLRRIRETTTGASQILPSFRREDFALIYVEPTECGAQLVEIRIDDHGRLMDQVPGGFFEETTWELF